MALDPGRYFIVVPNMLGNGLPPEDSEYEVRHMPDAEYRPIPSIWGHFAGGGINPEDTSFINGALERLLSEAV